MGVEATGKPFDAFNYSDQPLTKANINPMINTGAIARGKRTQPYPAPEMIEYIRSRGGKFILSSDAHFKEKLAYDFEIYENLL